MADVMDGACFGEAFPLAPCHEGCPTPSAHLAELVGVTALIAHIFDIHTLDMRAGVDHLDLGDDVVGVVTIDVVAARLPDAARLARMLHLTERPGHHGAGAGQESPAWRCWSGWVPAPPRGLPASLHVRAPVPV